MKNVEKQTDRCQTTDLISDVCSSKLKHMLMTEFKIEISL